MGIFNRAYETYESLDENKEVGEINEGIKVPLAPVSHIIAKAHIEVSLTMDGEFYNAEIVDKDDMRTIIPVSESSGSRSSGNAPHYLADNLLYVTSLGKEKHDKYLDQLKEWVESKFTHKKAKAVYMYVKSEKLLEDLSKKEIIKIKPDGKIVDKKINGEVPEKCVIRWKVTDIDSKYKDDCHKDALLFKSFENFYNEKLKEDGKELCSVTGEIVPITQNHPKGTVSFKYGAKLISANDTSGFTYRGRFTSLEEMGEIGYEVSQKSHNALRYIIANYGVRRGDMSLVWWNTKMKDMPKFDNLEDGRDDEDDDDSENENDKKYEIRNYKNSLKESILGYKQTLKEEDDVVVATFEAATTGRLSLTYYSEMKAHDFLNKLDRWYESIGLLDGRRQYPNFYQIINCAYGVESSKMIKVQNEKIISTQTKALLGCMLDGRPIPENIVKRLVENASSPHKYSDVNYRKVLYTATAVIRKYINDRKCEEFFGQELDRECRNSSYLFGRLLAVLNKVEKDCHQEDNQRTNASRLHNNFINFPAKTFAILDEKLAPYYAKLYKKSYVFYKKEIQNIASLIDFEDMKDKRLDNEYLIGYFHENAMLYKKKEFSNEQKNNTEKKDIENKGLESKLEEKKAITANTDRSYLFGRLLAVYDKIQRDTYNSNENRQTIASQYQLTFSQRPMQTAVLIEHKIIPYLNKIDINQMKQYKIEIQEIFVQLSLCPELNLKLDSKYILGYYHQYKRMFERKNDDLEKEKRKRILESIDLSKNEKYFIYGRLLAVLDKVERDTFDKYERRQSNVDKYRTAFLENPDQCIERLIAKSEYYIKKNKYGKFYEKKIKEISTLIEEEQEGKISQKYFYLLGYYSQYASLYKKNK